MVGPLETQWTFKSLNSGLIKNPTLSEVLGSRSGLFSSQKNRLNHQSLLCLLQRQETVERRKKFTKYGHFRKEKQIRSSLNNPFDPICQVLAWSLGLEELESRREVGLANPSWSQCGPIHHWFLPQGKLLWSLKLPEPCELSSKETSSPVGRNLSSDLSLPTPAWDSWGKFNWEQGRGRSAIQ